MGYHFLCMDWNTLSRSSSDKLPTTHLAKVGCGAVTTTASSTCFIVTHLEQLIGHNLKDFSYKKHKEMMGHPLLKGD